MSDAREIARKLIECAERDEWQALEDAITQAIERACAEACAEEREACAKLAEDYMCKLPEPCGWRHGPHNGACEQIAEWIRDRAKGEADREGLP